MNAAEALTLAHAAGVRVRTDGDDLVLEASAPPPPAVLDLLSRHKADIMTHAALTGTRAATDARTDSATAVSGGAEHAGPERGRMPHKPQWSLGCTLLRVVGRLAGPILLRCPRADASAPVARASGGGASARRPKAGAARPAIRLTTYPRMP